jgi:3-hydroxyisobutyrate dehydrogenase-like beta-hydroxyacid dehydrogenase
MGTVERVGVIGLGRIGHQFPPWLRAAGYDVVVHDVDPERVAAVAEAADAVGEDPADVTRSADVVVLSLPGNPYVETVMEGADGVLEALTSGQAVLDTGTTTPDLEAFYADRCADLGAHYLEAPLTYGGPGEAAGEGSPFTMFVGGSDAAYAHLRDVVACLSDVHEHVGGIGMGQVTKAAHRMRQNCRAAVDAEMVEFMRHNGVDPAQVASFMGWDLRDRFLAEEYPRVEGFHEALADPDPETSDVSENSYEVQEAGARPRLARSQWIKDQEYALDVARSSNTATPILSTVYQSLLATENYAAALADRGLEFGDPDGWEGRRDVVAHYRRLNRPREEWQRLQTQGGRKDG